MNHFIFLIIIGLGLPFHGRVHIEVDKLSVSAGCPSVLEPKASGIAVDSIILLCVASLDSSVQMPSIARDRVSGGCSVES